MSTIEKSKIGRITIHESAKEKSSHEYSIKHSKLREKYSDIKFFGDTPKTIYRIETEIGGWAETLQAIQLSSETGKENKVWAFNLIITPKGKTVSSHMIEKAYLKENPDSPGYYRIYLEDE